MLNQHTLQHNPGFVVRQDQVRKPVGFSVGIASLQKIWRWHCPAPSGIPDAMWGFLRMPHLAHYPVS
jgi:hypothetical protein